ncbi:MAG: hypothetical protein ACFFAS_00240 [Promethearchaeota archaeon]
MRARACTKCKTYAVIHANNPVSQNRIKVFEKVHAGHSMVTVDYFEIRDEYRRFKIDEVPQEEKTVIS